MSRSFEALVDFMDANRTSEGGWVQHESAIILDLEIRGDILARSVMRRVCDHLFDDYDQARISTATRPDVELCTRCFEIIRCRTRMCDLCTTSSGREFKEILKLTARCGIYLRICSKCWEDPWS